jgi:hypothetical protein
VTLTERIAQRQGACTAIAQNGDRCTRSEPHGPDDIHTAGGGRSWGFRPDPGLPEWLRLARLRPYGMARDETGRSVL